MEYGIQSASVEREMLNNTRRKANILRKLSGYKNCSDNANRIVEVVTFATSIDRADYTLWMRAGKS